MMAPHAVFLVLALGLSVALADNMTRGVYEHYTEGGIKSGLRGEGENFYLNDKKLFLHSGALHYFRVHPGYWRDRLKKLRAAGLVAVETYVPWNLHNPQKGVFDFGKGGDDMSPFLDIQQFLKIAKEEDLLVLVRSGPYICAEWEFGGMPSWLLRDPQMKFRSSQGPYETAVKEYFDNLLPILRDQQFTKGGPIIAFQIENEYGNTKEANKDTDLAHLANLKKMMEDHCLVELFYTSDTPTVGQKYGALPGVLMTANFNSRVTAELTQLNAWQPDKPSMVMEYWSGWFDHWGEKHHTVDPKQFSSLLEEILDFPAHVNFYMFHGGTSFGFMNGANVNNGFPFYAPDISSYDYDAPLSEAGDYTPKYHSTKAILAAHQSVPISVPELPAETVKEQYEDLVSTQVLEWDNILSQVPASAKQTAQFTNYMEMLDINNKSGQSYGYVAYRTHTNITPQTPTTPLSIRGQLKGVAMVVVDGKRQTKPLTKTDDLNGFGYWIANDSTIFLAVNPKGSTVDVIVENWGRNNFGKLYEFNETRGLAPGQILIDYQVQENWEIFSLEFKGKWINSLTGWSPVAPNATLDGPLLLNFNLNVKDEPKDTFIDMRGWGKGVVFVNGFNLGRFCSLGPARTLYVPAPLLKTGQNQIVVFEHFTPPKDDQGRVVLKFSKGPIWEPIQNPIRISFSS